MTNSTKDTVKTEKKTDEITKDKLDKVSGGQVPPITLAVDSLRDTKMRLTETVDLSLTAKSVLNRP